MKKCQENQSLSFWITNERSATLIWNKDGKEIKERGKKNMEEKKILHDISEESFQ